MAVMNQDHVERGPTAASLTTLLVDDMVSWEHLQGKHGALLKVVDTVLGVVPHCDRYLEIWPPAFRTYNVLVPNLLNLPVPVLGVGGPPARDVGLAMYVASRTAECPYCSAHSCSFALRRGASPETVAAALLPDQGSFTRAELATIAVARSLSRVPCELTAAERAELVDVYGEHNAEWVVLGVVMMGFLNKFMDAIGVELEQTVVDEARSSLGEDWSAGKAGVALQPAAEPRAVPPPDSWRTRLRLLPLLPAAVRFDRAAQRGVPRGRPEVGSYLKDLTGHDFPMLARVHSGRARRSIASMIQENLDASTSVVGLDIKLLTGFIYAQVVHDERLAGDVRALAHHARIDNRLLDGVADFAHDGTAPPTLDDPLSAALLILARAASHSPARVDATTVAVCRDAGLTAAAIVEVVTWLAVLQLLHRLGCYTTCAG